MRRAFVGLFGEFWHALREGVGRMKPVRFDRAGLRRRVAMGAPLLLTALLSPLLALVVLWGTDWSAVPLANIALIGLLIICAVWIAPIAFAAVRGRISPRAEAISFRGDRMIVVHPFYASFRRDQISSVAIETGQLDQTPLLVVRRGGRRANFPTDVFDLEGTEILARIRAWMAS